MDDRPGHNRLRGTNDIMTEVAAVNQEQTDAESVRAYLLGHPDFFLEHPEVLRQIQVPHLSGEAVSLVEKQVSLLREQHELTRKKLHELIEIARENEELARRMHTLALTLMEGCTMTEVFNTLYESLRRNFRVDHVAVRIFARPVAGIEHQGDEFAGSDAPEYGLFKWILERRMPLSGRLKRQQQAFLFGNEGDDIASAVIVPLTGKEWSGVLSIGSTDSNRFTESMGVELLANLGEILSYVLKPWVMDNPSGV